MRAVPIYFTITACVVVLLVYAASLRFSSSSRDTPFPHWRPRPDEIAPTPSEILDDEGLFWTFNHERDLRNYGLSDAQCSSAFPFLYKEIDRAVAHRTHDKVRIEEVDTAWRGDGIVRAMIWENQLYIIENRGVWDGNHRPRSIGTLHSLHRAISAYPGHLPNIEFTITDHDSANLGDKEHTTWAYARLPEQEHLWLMPDFGLWAWPDVGLRSYAELQTLIADTEPEFVDKKPQLVWRGSVAVGSQDVRAGLLRASAHQSWSDVRALDWHNATDVRDNLLGMEDHCAYMFVAQTEGNTYSGRLKYLLNCQSVLVSHKLRFIEHFHHLMQPTGPEQNYVQVKRDFSDLPRRIEKMLAPEQLEATAKIAGNARRVFRERYLTPAAVSCYWRQLIRGWSQVQGFETQFWKEVEVEKGGETKTVRRPRGVPFESYVIMEAVEWDIPTKPRKICEYE
ncbi:hypothetical protein MBLNU459_g4936t1 [Dothideomycetes sp. NU459]